MREPCTCLRGGNVEQIWPEKVTVGPSTALFCQVPAPERHGAARARYRPLKLPIGSIYMRPDMTPNDPKRTEKAVESVQRLCGSDLDSYQTHLQCSCQMSPKYQVMKPRRLRARSDRPLNPSHLNPLAPTILDEQMLKIDLESLTDDCGSYSTNEKK